MEQNKDLITGGEIPLDESTKSEAKEASEKSALAYKIFKSGIKRAENLLKINKDKDSNTLSIPEDKLLDSYRAVIVLSISALDSYIKTFLIVEIKKSLKEKKLSQDLKKYIKEELFNKEELYDVVLEENFYEKVISKFDLDFEKRSFQGQKSIEKFMKLAGVNQVFKQISISADKSVDKLYSSIEKFTTRRHEIVHCGDHDLTQTELTENKICETDAAECIDLVKLIANEIHKISQGS